MNSKEGSEEAQQEKELNIPETVMQALNGVAKVIGVAVGELWIIFCRQYLVRGLTEAFTGIVLVIASFFLYSVIGLWVLVPLAIALMFFYGAILLIGNPRYYALEDITERVKDFRESETGLKAYKERISRGY